MAVKERYKLIGSPHYERNPDHKGNPLSEKAHTKYERGSIVESDRNLVEVYPGKFELVVERQPIVVSEERKLAVERMLSDKLIQQDDVEFLEGMTDDNFQRALRMMGKTSASPKSGEEEKSLFGENVTHQHQRAYDHGFRVYRNASGKFNITQPGTPNKAVNPKPLDQKEVDKFVENFLKER